MPLRDDTSLPLSEDAGEDQLRTPDLLLGPDVRPLEQWGAPDDVLGEEIQACYLARIRRAMRDEDGQIMWPYGVALTYRMRPATRIPALWVMTVRATPNDSWSPMPTDSVDGMWLTGAALESLNNARLTIWGTPGTLAQLYAPPNAGHPSSPLPWAWMSLIVASPHQRDGGDDAGDRWVSRVALASGQLTHPLILAGSVPLGWP